MELPSLVQATEHITQQGGEGPQNVHMLQICHIFWTVIFRQLGKVTPVIYKRLTSCKAIVSKSTFDSVLNLHPKKKLHPEITQSEKVRKESDTLVFSLGSSTDKPAGSLGIPS